MVTAMPYAAASALDVLKPTTIRIVLIARNTLICGTYTWPDLVLRRVLDVEARKVAELNRLARQRERPRDQRLGRDDRRRGRDGDRGQQHPAGRQTKERLRRGLGHLQQHRALAEVVQEQGRKHEREPREPDGPPAEVPHVGVERLAAGDHEKHRAENDEAVIAVVAEERHRVARIDGAQHGRLGHDPSHAEYRDERRTTPA